MMLRLLIMKFVSMHACMHDVQLVILFYTAITMTIMLLDLAVSMHACMPACKTKT